MVRKRVTQRQVADASGVSQTTVSLILAGDTSINVSDTTRERVLSTATSLGYVPQAAARALVQGRSNVLALVLYDPHAQIFRDPYIPNVMTGLIDVAGKQDYRLLVERIPAGADLTIVNNLLRGRQADGVVMVNVRAKSPILSALHGDGYPIVVLDTFEEHRLPSVGIDHRGGIRALTQHLVSLGHRRIGCIPYTPIDNDHMRERFGAFRSVLESNGLEIDMSLVVSGRMDPDTGSAAMQQILAHPSPPTAIFAMNDMMALGALHACAKAGVRVPDDIAIVGYDDMRFSEFLTPALTTVRAPEIELGRAAASALLDMIEGKSNQFVYRELETELVIRASCGAAAPR